MLGPRLRQLRREKGLSQGELADRAGINRSYLSMIENARSSPTMDVVQRLSKGLEVNIWRLITDVNEQQYVYDLDEGFDMYDGLRNLLNDSDEIMLIRPTIEEIEMLKGIRFSGGFKPDKRFYRDALLAYRRRTPSTSSSPKTTQEQVQDSPSSEG